MSTLDQIAYCRLPYSDPHVCLNVSLDLVHRWHWHMAVDMAWLDAMVRYTFCFGISLIISIRQVLVNQLYCDILQCANFPSPLILPFSSSSKRWEIRSIEQNNTMLKLRFQGCWWRNQSHRVGSESWCLERSPFERTGYVGWKTRWTWERRGWQAIWGCSGRTFFEACGSPREAVRNGRSKWASSCCCLACRYIFPHWPLFRWLIFHRTWVWWGRPTQTHEILQWWLEVRSFSCQSISI